MTSRLSDLWQNYILPDDILHYFHKFIFVLRGLLFDKFSRHSIIEIISIPIPMENDGIDFTYLRFFAKPSKFIFTKYQISLNLI